MITGVMGIVGRERTRNTSLQKKKEVKRGFEPSRWTIVSKWKRGCEKLGVPHLGRACLDSRVNVRWSGRADRQRSVFDLVSRKRKRRKRKRRKRKRRKRKRKKKKKKWKEKGVWRREG